MSSTSQFEDKAQRLFNRLNAATNPAKIIKNKTQYTPKTPSPQQLFKIKQEMEASDCEARKKMRILTDNLKKLEATLTDENVNRSKADDVFQQSVAKLEKNMKYVLTSVQKSFLEKQKKLEEKIDALIKAERKDIENKLQDNESLLEEMTHLEERVTALAREVTDLRKSRLELEERITKQFNDQLRQLKRIFENDVREREEKEGKSLTTLKTLYKGAMERIYAEERQREQSEKMLMAVVEQLVTHIIET